MRAMNLQTGFTAKNLQIVRFAILEYASEPEKLLKEFEAQNFESEEALSDWCFEQQFGQYLNDDQTRDVLDFIQYIIVESRNIWVRATDPEISDNFEDRRAYCAYQISSNN